MHMADALLSPTVGGAMWVATGAAVAYSARRLQKHPDESRIPLMGVTGAFIFAAQMLNFSIPGTGSSGHLGGGLLLAVLLGPEAALLVMASILGVQALFFADGGLLAWGANVFNLGVLPAFVAYPLIYRRIVGGGEPTRRRVMIASIVAAVIGLQLGALAVVLETSASGISSLPFATFVALMLPIHLAIGVVEGLVTAVVLLFVLRAQPDLLDSTKAAPVVKLSARRRRAPLLIGFVIAALFAGGVLSWFASANADGLEWSIAKVLGGDSELVAESATHHRAAAVQERLALLPDYAFKQHEAAAPEPADSGDSWPAASGGTTTAGIVGVVVTLVIAAVIGAALQLRAARRSRSRPQH